VPMDQTPATEIHNPYLLQLIPRHAKNIVEVGCGSGALAREYKKLNATCHYVGIDIVPEHAMLARRHCDSVVELDIEAAVERFFKENSSCECWIFADSLEHLRDPWSVLSKIRRVIPSTGNILACIPNAQHWSVQARLNCGEFKYELNGLLDKSHLRWFTRMTIVEMFNDAGFNIAEGHPRILDEPQREKFLPSVRAMAISIGADGDTAVNDAIPFQYLIRAVPAGEPV